MSNIYFQKQQILLDNNIRTFVHTQDTTLSMGNTLYTLFDLPSTTLAFYYIYATVTDNGFMHINLGQTNEILDGRGFTYGYIFCINQHIGTLYNSDGNINSCNIISDSLTLYGQYHYGGETMTTNIYGFYIA